MRVPHDAVTGAIHCSKTDTAAAQQNTPGWERLGSRVLGAGVALEEVWNHSQEALHMCNSV
jgi:hypothetical protein